MKRQKRGAPQMVAPQLILHAAAAVPALTTAVEMMIGQPARGRA
jgi:hypothetical protein